MADDLIPSSDKLAQKSLLEDKQDDELSETNVHEQRPPPVNMAGSRTAGDGVPDADSKSERGSQGSHPPAAILEP